MTITDETDEIRDRAKRWVLAEEARQKYPRISMHRVSSGR